MAGLLLACFGPMLIVVATVTAAVGFSAPEGEGVRAALMAGFLVAFPAVCSAAAALVLGRWCFPDADWRGAGMASALLSTFGLFGSPGFLSLLVAGGFPSDPMRAVMQATGEIIFGFGFALVAVMGAVLLVEFPFRLMVASANRRAELGAAQSLRCAASVLVISLGWLLLEESASERLQNLLNAFRG